MWFEAGLSLLLPIPLQNISNVFTHNHSRAPFSVEGLFPSVSSHLPCPARTFLHHPPPPRAALKDELSVLPQILQLWAVSLERLKELKTTLNNFAGTAMCHGLLADSGSSPRLHCSPKQSTKKTEHKLPVSIRPIPHRRSDALLCFKIALVYLYVSVLFCVKNAFLLCFGSLGQCFSPGCANRLFNQKQEKNPRLFLYISLLFQENKYLLN
ncbi:hypothetical protein HJG60_009535 [Phyllostomus discolor]|uniref:Uncharacterized protein n=1 Tax=Phyllostomus discolor TaxID=89673 RepID=A0A834DC65_9CHIR|nr:hypothetical protein HJG60_009535 [Phyllostomus discolor]